MFQSTGTLCYEEPQFSEKFVGALSGRNHRYATLVFTEDCLFSVMTWDAGTCLTR